MSHLIDVSIVEDLIELAGIAIEVFGALGVLVVIRTLLSWVLVLEVESRWPWQPAKR